MSDLLVLLGKRFDPLLELLPGNWAWWQHGAAVQRTFGFTGTFHACKTKGKWPIAITFFEHIHICMTRNNVCQSLFKHIYIIHMCMSTYICGDWLFFILEFVCAPWGTKNKEIGRWWCLVLALIRCKSLTFSCDFLCIWLDAIFRKSIEGQGRRRKGLHRLAGHRHRHRHHHHPQPTTASDFQLTCRITPPPFNRLKMSDFPDSIFGYLAFVRCFALKDFCLPPDCSSPLLNTPSPTLFHQGSGCRSCVSPAQVKGCSCERGRVEP